MKVQLRGFTDRLDVRKSDVTQRSTSSTVVEGGVIIECGGKGFGRSRVWGRE